MRVRKNYLSILAVIALFSLGALSCMQNESEINMVRLKTGEKVEKGALLLVYAFIKNLSEKKVIAFYELVEKVRNPEYELSGNIREVLKERKLLAQEGNVPDVVAKIVTASVEGEGIHMRLVYPAKPKHQL